MNHANTKFIATPEIFLETNVVDNINWLQKAGQPSATADNQRIVMANTLKEANFDLAESGSESRVYDFRFCGDVTTNDMPIRAYWCPFVQGTVLPGYVDIPRKSPQYQFLFTPAMNGCAFYITNSPEGNDKMRVFHNQHPDSEEIKRMIGSDPISTFSFEEYGSDSNPNAFNLMLYRDDAWYYISQPQQFTPGTHSFRVAFRTGDKVKRRPVFKS